MVSGWGRDRWRADKVTFAFIVLVNVDLNNLEECLFAPCEFTAVGTDCDQLTLSRDSINLFASARLIG